VVQLPGVLVPLAVAFVSSTWRWPTLRRRLREHLSLAKDFPEGVDRTQLHGLIDYEVRELARRERKRIDNQGDRQLALLRWGIVVVFGGLAIGQSQIIGDNLPFAEYVNRSAALVALAMLIIVVTWVCWALAGVMVRQLMRLRRQRRRLREGRTRTTPQPAEVVTYP